MKTEAYVEVCVPHCVNLVSNCGDSRGKLNSSGHERVAQKCEWLTRIVKKRQVN